MSGNVNSMSTKLLIFDFDGTLADSNQGIFETINYTLGKLGCKKITRFFFESLVGMPLERQLETILPEEKKEFAEQALKETIKEIKNLEKSLVSEEDLSKAGYKFIGTNLFESIGKRIYGPFDSTKSSFTEFALEEMEKILETNIKPRQSIFGTDASFYLEAEIFENEPNIVVLGPGNQLMAHTTNEFVETSHLKKYTDLYSKLTLNYLKK